MQPPSILPIWQCLCGAQSGPTNPFPRSWSFLQYNLPRPGYQKLLCTHSSLFSCVLCAAFIKPFSLAKQMAGREVWRGFESICPKRLLHLFSIYSSPCSKQNFVPFACVLSILYKSQWITSLWFSDIICTSIYQPSYVFFGVFDFLTSFAQAFINFHMSSLVSGHVLLKSEFTYGPCEVTGWWEPVYWTTLPFLCCQISMLFHEQYIQPSDLLNSHETSGALGFWSSCIFLWVSSPNPLWKQVLSSKVSSLLDHN